MKQLTSEKFNIPLIDQRDDLDCCKRYYRRAIYNTLLYIKPKYCLEVGSFIFQSSRCFSRYFKENCPDGKLITLDICKWTTCNLERVYPLMVYPYTEEVIHEHGGLQVYFKDWQRIVKQGLAPEFNMFILKQEMTSLNIKQFDFIFVDGSHSKESFENDLRMAKIFCRPEGYILIDDIYRQESDPPYDQYKIYMQLKLHNEFYEYEDWSVKPNMGLIKCKDFRIG